MNLDDDLMVFAEIDIKPIDVNLRQAIDHGLQSRLELRQRKLKVMNLVSI